MRKLVTKIERKGSLGVKVSSKSETVPDMALTTNEILRFHRRNNDVTIKPEAYDSSGELTYLSRMSDRDREQWRIDNQNRIDQLENEVNIAVEESRKAKKQKDREDLKDQLRKEIIDEGSAPI